MDTYIQEGQPTRFLLTRSFGEPRKNTGGARHRLLHVEELHLEADGLVRLDEAREALLAVRQLGRNGDLGALALRHQHDAFVPARDHFAAIDAELEGLAALVGVIKAPFDAAVLAEGVADVVHRDDVPAAGRGLAVTLDDLVHRHVAAAGHHCRERFFENVTADSNHKDNAEHRRRGRKRNKDSADSESVTTTLDG